MKPNTSANYLDVIPYTRVIIRLPDGSTLEKMGFYDRDLPTLTEDELPKRPGYVYQGCVDETGFEWYDVNGVGGHLNTDALVLYLDPVWKAIPQTGDNAPLAILCVLCACAGVGLWMSIRRKRAN